MTMIEDLDFSKINAFEGTQHDSFEELICVLAKREQPENAKEFRRMGRGPDGGVEAIWYLNDGRKIAYQAKFLLSLRSNWNQITKSVERALEVHPELKEYIVALPIAPTGSTTKDKNKKSGWDIWDEKIEEWNNLAAEKGMAVEFKLWTKTDLIDKLSTDENVSLLQLWFGETVLNDSWFQKQVKIATQVLDNRYNPHDHVQISTESVFDTMVRGDKINKQIEKYTSQMRNTKIPDINLKATEHISNSDILQISQATDKTKEAKNKLIMQLSSLKQDFSQPWNINSVKKSIDELGISTRSLENAYSKIDDQNETLYSLALRTLDQLLSSCYDLYDLFQEEPFLAEAAKCAVIHGPAGAGKSHLFGRIAQQRVENGLPTVLLLGQDFSSSDDLWDRIGAHLNLNKRTPEAVLGLLNIAGKRKKTRALLLIDAINEGAGSTYWREKVPELLAQLSKYPNLGIAFSCREEYLSYAIPDSQQNSLPKFPTRGFSNLEEIEHAAVQYLDKRGIARPNTLWHSPEFFNPLFLKSASEAMEAQGKKEFPPGMSGITELIGVYLDALCHQTIMRGSNPDQVKRATKKLVREFSKEMAEERHDFIEYDCANEITNICFRNIPSPVNKPWLEILIDASLFRLDPPPFSEDIDLLDPPSDRIRFAFQRFQDYLMAEALISDINPDKLKEAFEETGALHFLNLHYGGDYRYEGLIRALSTIYPEEFGVEFITTLPRWKKVLLEEQLLQEAFIESAKWRRKNAFSKKTLEIFELLEDKAWVDCLGLLLDVSMMTDHPWNAFFLHDSLKEQTLPERDSYWTQSINLALRNTSSNVDRIVSWASSDSIKEADTQHLRLASLVLVWLLSSSHRTLRDRATKALTTIFLEHSGIFIFLSEKIADCDDPYIIERFYAAAYGACCNNPNTERLASYSAKVYEAVFAGKNPPVALLTRDYALGIMELAEHHQVLDDDIDMDFCRPPYNSEEPDLDLSEGEVKQLANERGDKTILFSSHWFNGDFGRYTVSTRVDSFSTQKLDQDQLGSETPESISEEQCCLWVAKRAYELGWDSELFPRDGYESGYSRSRNDLERVGKKYQHIALDELLARLADNFWIKEGGEEPYKYQYSNRDFCRNIEPTILPGQPRFSDQIRILKDWIIQPNIHLPKTAKKDLPKWPFLQDPAETMKDKLIRIDGDKKRWLVLYEYNFEQQDYKDCDPKYGDLGLRCKEFRFLHCIFLQRDIAGSFLSFIKRKKNLDVSYLHPTDYIDGPYLLEAFWRNTWNSEKFHDYFIGDEDKHLFATPLARYYWESHLDQTIPNGFGAYMPQKWFFEELGLVVPSKNLQSWRDRFGNCVIQIGEITGDRIAIVIDESKLKDYTKKFDVEPIWLMVAERNAYPEGTKFGIPKLYSRRSEGVVWFENDELSSKNWKRDHPESRTH